VPSPLCADATTLSIRSAGVEFGIAARGVIVECSLSTAFQRCHVRRDLGNHIIDFSDRLGPRDPRCDLCGDRVRHRAVAAGCPFAGQQIVRKALPVFSRSRWIVVRAPGRNKLSRRSWPDLICTIDPGVAMSVEIIVRDLVVKKVPDGPLPSFTLPHDDADFV